MSHSLSQEYDKYTGGIPLPSLSWQRKKQPWIFRAKEWQTDSMVYSRFSVSKGSSKLPPVDAGNWEILNLTYMLFYLQHIYIVMHFNS